MFEFLAHSYFAPSPNAHATKQWSALSPHSKRANNLSTQTHNSIVALRMTHAGDWRLATDPARNTSA